MLRQGPARRLLARQAVDLHRSGDLGGGRCLGRRLFQIGELELELLDEPGGPLGRGAEARLAQLGDDELELLDLEHPGLRLGLRVEARGALDPQHRLQRLDVIGQRSGGDRHPAIAARFTRRVGSRPAPRVIMP